MKIGAFHQHPGKEQHGITFAAAGSTKVSAAFAVSLRLQVPLDVFKQLGCRKILRIPAHNFCVLVGAVRKIDKILNDTQQPVFAEKAAHHGYERADAIQLLVIGLDFAPGVKKVVRGKEGAILVVRTVADDQEGVVFEQFRNIPAIAHGELDVGIHDGSVFFDSTLELQHHHRNAVEKDNTVRNAKLTAHPFDLKLVDDLEDVVFRTVVIHQLDVQILLGTVFPVENEAVAEQLAECFVGFVDSAGNGF